MNDRLCRIFVSAGIFEGKLADFVTKQAGASLPLLAWSEPDLTAVVVDNQTGRRDDFQPLVRGAPRWPADLPLVEARLFWHRSALHAVGDDHGGRWMRIEEGAGNDSDKVEEVTREQFGIYTLRDRQRFGLGAESDGLEQLFAIQYRRGGRLIAWRLTLGEV